MLTLEQANIWKELRNKNYFCPTFWSGFCFLSMVVLITGGSKGIGKATAYYFHKKGAKVIITYNESEESAKKMQNDGIDIFRCNVKDDSQVNSLIDYVYQKYASLDIVINNAGKCLMQKMLIDTTCEEFDEIFSVNVKGVYNVTKSALCKMLYTGGKIINITSIFAKKGGSCEVIYSSSKSAISGFTRAIADELAFSKVGVCELAVGLVDTQMNSHLSQSEMESFIKEYNQKKVLQPQDVAKKIYAITQKENEKINGKVYRI